MIRQTIAITDHMGSEVSPGATAVYHQNVQKPG